MNDQKVAVITGSSSGIGLESALVLARNGYITYATMRSPEKDTSIKEAVQNESLPIRVVQLDVTDDTSVKNAMDHIISEAGRIDVLVNNAGYSLGGALEDLSMEEIKSQYETNLFGLIRVTQAVLPTMRKQRSGRILNISSGAGIFGFPVHSAYVSTKFAVEGLSESIAYELEPFGIKVILIEPGFIRTNFIRAMVVAKKAQDPASPYSELMQKLMANASELAKNASEADFVANIILDAASNPSPRLRYLAGKDVESWAAGKKNMDEFEFFNMIKKLIA
ncbi:MAG: SDR family oxidoreductase [Nitrososphaeraceae archaeon]|jgi:NAD(P)-dependent dehydrogenase (short-subunit alcohol dehydrogenase family)